MNFATSKITTNYAKKVVTPEPVILNRHRRWLDGLSLTWDILRHGATKSWLYMKFKLQNGNKTSNGYVNQTPRKPKQFPKNNMHIMRSTSQNSAKVGKMLVNNNNFQQRFREFRKNVKPTPQYYAEVITTEKLRASNNNFQQHSKELTLILRRYVNQLVRILIRITLWIPGNNPLMNVQP